MAQAFDIGDASRQFFDEGMRFERIISIPLTLADVESTPDYFNDDFVEWLPESEDDAIYAALPELKRFAGMSEYPEAYDVADALFLHGRTGFLIQIARCVRQYLGGGTFASGWGYQHLHWIYAETMEEAVAIALAYNESETAAEKAKLGEAA